MAPPMMKAGVNAKVNFSTLYLISEMVAGFHIKLYQVCCGLAIRAQSFVFPFIFPLSKLAPVLTLFHLFFFFLRNLLFGVHSVFP